MMRGEEGADSKNSYPSGGTEGNRSRVVWGKKNDGRRCEAREMREGGQVDRCEDGEV